RALNANPNFTWAGQNIVVKGVPFRRITTLPPFPVRTFFIGGEGSSSTGSVTIQNLEFEGSIAKGGDGRNGGGGGLGAGGALFIGKNTKTIVENCSFVFCKAIGGSGATGIGGGGGGLKGNGSAGGGGFGGNGAIAGGGCSGFDAGNSQEDSPG